MHVSVMTIAHNTPPALLRQAWESLCAQTLGDWRLVLVDDGSTRDDTLAELAAIATDPRVLHRRLPENVGQAVARNAALELCQADLVAILDSDDIALPDWLARQVAYMDAHPEVHICGCQIEAFQGKAILGRTTHPALITQAVIQAQAAKSFLWFLNNPGVIYRRKAILALGGYNPSLRRGEDFDLWMRAHRAGLVIHNQLDILYYYRR